VDVEAMTDTTQASHITDHPFKARVVDAAIPARWWDRCECGLSEAAHRDRSRTNPAIVLADPAGHNHPVVAGAVASLDCPACFTEANR
jgi:hypothetical protein